MINSNKFHLTNVWDSIKGKSWPRAVPVSKEDIDNLPDWVKKEIKELHNLNLYEQVSTKVVQKYYQEETKTAQARLLETAEFWNDEYNKVEYIYGKKPNAYIEEHATKYFKAGQKVLSIADGEGRNSIWLSKQGLDVTAFDISPVAVLKAKQLAVEENVQVDFNVCSCERWDWKPNQYHGIVASFIQFSNPKLRKFIFENMIRSLMPGGVLIVIGFSVTEFDQGIAGPLKKENYYNQPMLKKLLKSTNILTLDEFDSTLNQGIKHTTKHHLLGVVAQKNIQ